MEELAVRNNVANKSEIKQYIVIRINNEFFGIDIMNVDSIVKIQQITRVPKSQDYFIGVINLRFFYLIKKYHIANTAPSCKIIMTGIPIMNLLCFVL